MLSRISALVRGRLFEVGEAAADREGPTILRQQIRDSAAAIGAAQRAIAVATAQNVQELDRYRRIVARIEDLEARASIALDQQKLDLAREAAESIARLEVDRDVSGEAQRTFHQEIQRLKEVVHKAEARLRDLRHGERLVAATDRTHRLRISAPNTGLPALKGAEETLRRIRTRQLEAEATATAMDELEQLNNPARIAEKLADAGCGTPILSRADAVMARLTARNQPSQ